MRSMPQSCWTAPKGYILALLLAACVAPKSTQCGELEEFQPQIGVTFIQPWEPRKAGWFLRLDNDAFTSKGADQDYTGSVSLAFAGRRAADNPFSLNPVLRLLDRASGFDGRLQQIHDIAPSHLMQFGVQIFTPTDKSTARPISEDRPYANLAYLTNSRYAPGRTGKHFYQSSLTLGILGTRVGEELQDFVHRAIGAQESQGFDNQVSDGGELTARYAIARHTLLHAGPHHDLKASFGGSIGYLTDFSTALSLRVGRRFTPWWISPGDHSHYSSQPAIMMLGRGSSNEGYFSAGIRVRLSLYNAFLQGQVRNSAVSFTSSELEKFSYDAWLGYTTQFPDFQLHYAIRFQSKEIRQGPGAREQVWGSVTLEWPFD